MVSPRSSSPRRLSTAVTTILFLILCPSAAPKDPFTICDKNVFGAPNPYDCEQAMFWIPYINAPASSSRDAKAMRLFSEPQLQKPPFKEIVKNQKYAPRGIEQLPKVWKYLAAVTQPYQPRVHYPVTVKGEFVAGIYIFTSDSLFNSNLMNPYLAEGKIIAPPGGPYLSRLSTEMSNSADNGSMPNRSSIASSGLLLNIHNRPFISVV
ncbi:MAG: hypothetical protein Q9173_004720 [Seirophora scorigena]